MSHSAPLVSVGLSGFTVSPSGLLLRPGDDVGALSAAGASAGRSWAVADPGSTTTDVWLARVDAQMATLLVVDADRSVALRRRVDRATAAKGGPLDGVLLRESGRVSQERAWPAVAEMVDEGALRCAGLVTARSAVLQRCMAWHPVDAVLLPESAPAGDRDALADVCRWSGVTLLVTEGDEVRALDSLNPGMAAPAPTRTLPA